MREEIARALRDEMPCLISERVGDELADVVLAVLERRGDATCGDLSPSINFGGDGDAERLMCELPVGHGGAHQAATGDGLPPTRWMERRGDDDAARVRRVEALHLPSHSWCFSCDKSRDVEMVGNNPDCAHHRSYCCACDHAWPCPTIRALDGDDTGSGQ